MSGLLNIGRTGLNAAQAQLNTTSHNITNAGVEGYTRQRVIQSTQDPLFTGVGFFGQGTSIAGINRQYSQFIENQVLNSSNRLSELSKYNEQISQINNLLADQSSGLTPALQEFFKGVQEVAANPSSVPARQSLLSTAEAMVNRFQTLDQRMSEVRQGVEGEIDSLTRQISTYAEKIAEINGKIVIAQQAGPAIPANDLLDQRNQLVAELNKFIKVSSVVQADGQLSVFVGSGQNLVLGQTFNTLQAVQGLNDPQRFDIQLVDGAGNTVRLPENILTGGALGGLLDFRRNTLDDAQNRLGLVALGMAETFNAQHRLGIDLDGVLGGDFFNAPQPNVIPAGGVTATVTDIGALAPSDYLLQDVGGSYELVRLSDRTRTAVAGFPVTIDGLTIDAPVAPFPAQGVLIQPTRYASRDLDVALIDPRKVAAGSPMSVEAPVSNGGNGKVSLINVTDVAGMDADSDGVPDFPAFDMVFDSATNTFTLPAGYTMERYNPATDTWAASNAYNPATDAAGVTFRIAAAAGFEFAFKVSGAPINNDLFRFDPTDKGVADNRNAVALGALQTMKTLFSSSGGNATATFQSVYSQLVSTVGNKTREVQVGEQAQEVLLKQAKDSREALSGVNLDEEAANLIRYQQAYQATAQVMTVAQRLFDELIGIAR